MTKAYQIADYPRYTIWSNGLVWSSGNKRHKPRFLREYLNNAGYVCVWLSNDKGRKVHYIHRLVAEAFLPKSSYKEVNHIDGNKQNNSVSNLEWKSRSKNVQHAFDVGLKKAKKGETTYNHKLTNKKVIYIRNFVKQHGKKYKILAQELGVSPSTVRRADNGQGWSHV